MFGRSPFLNSTLDSTIKVSVPRTNEAHPIFLFWYSSPILTVRCLRMRIRKAQRKRKPRTQKARLLIFPSLSIQRAGSLSPHARFSAYLLSFAAFSKAATAFASFWRLSMFLLQSACLFISSIIGFISAYTTRQTKKSV